MKKKLFNVNKLIEEENNQEGFPFKILFQNNNEVPYELNFAEGKNFLKIYVNLLPQDSIENQIEKRNLIDIAKQEPLDLNAVNKKWKEARRYFRDERLIGSVVTSIDLDETSELIFISLLLRNTKKKIYATQYSTIKNVFKNYLTFTMTKDLLDIVKEKSLGTNQGENYKVQISALIQDVFGDNSLKIHLDNAYLKSTEILKTTLKEFLIAYGQVLSENYLKLFDILTEEEIPKVKGLGEMNYLPEEFMINHLTRIYRTLSDFIKKNESKKQLKLLRVLTNKGIGADEKEEAQNIETKIFNKLQELRVFLLKTLEKSTSLDDFIRVLDKNIRVYEDYLRKDIEYILHPKNS